MSRAQSGCICGCASGSSFARLGFLFYIPPFKPASVSKSLWIKTEHSSKTLNGISWPAIRHNSTESKTIRPFPPFLLPGDWSSWLLSPLTCLLRMLEAFFEFSSSTSSRWSSSVAPGNCTAWACPGTTCLKTVSPVLSVWSTSGSFLGEEDLHEWLSTCRLKRQQEDKKAFKSTVTCCDTRPASCVVNKPTDSTGDCYTNSGHRQWCWTGLSRLEFWSTKAIECYAFDGTGWVNAPNNYELREHSPLACSVDQGQYDDCQVDHAQGHSNPVSSPQHNLLHKNTEPKPSAKCCTCWCKWPSHFFKMLCSLGWAKHLSDQSERAEQCTRWHRSWSTAASRGPPGRRRKHHPRDSRPSPHPPYA